MRIRAHTASGSVYGLDDEAMTWERLSKHDILGLPDTRITGGDLSDFPLVAIGLSIVLHDVKEGRIHTTRVVLAEEVG